MTTPDREALKAVLRGGLLLRPEGATVFRLLADVVKPSPFVADSHEVEAALRELEDDEFVWRTWMVVGGHVVETWYAS